MKCKILVIDYDKTLSEKLSKKFEEEGFEVICITDIVKLQNILYSHGDKYDCIISELILPGGKNGIELLKEVKKNYFHTCFIILTEFATIENAVTAIKEGATDFIRKSHDFEEIVLKIKKNILENKLKNSNDKKIPLEAFFKLFSSPIRLKIIKLLHKKEKLKLIEIKKNLNIMHGPKLSYHLNILKEARIIRKDEVNNYILTGEGKRFVNLLELMKEYVYFEY